MTTTVLTTSDSSDKHVAPQGRLCACANWSDIGYYCCQNLYAYYSYNGIAVLNNNENSRFICYTAYIHPNAPPGATKHVYSKAYIFSDPRPFVFNSYRKCSKCQLRTYNGKELRSKKFGQWKSSAWGQTAECFCFQNVPLAQGVVPPIL